MGCQPAEHEVQVAVKFCQLQNLQDAKFKPDSAGLPGRAGPTFRPEGAPSWPVVVRQVPSHED